MRIAVKRLTQSGFHLTLCRMLSGGGAAGLLLLCSLTATGCFAWTEDSRGNLTSVGLPGIPLWQAHPDAASAQPITPTDMGFTREEASRLGGPVMVIPPDSASAVWRYRYYQAGGNRCEDDLKKMLQERAAIGATGPAPYCTSNPTIPPAKGSAFLF